MVTKNLFLNPRFIISLEIWTQSAFTAFRVLLPSAYYSAEWSGRVWPPVADINGFLKFEVLQTAIIVSNKLQHPTHHVQVK